ncbi:MAG: acyl-CoA/acyl-ACP dehydrogenase [Dehalococcoidales bacterium]|nr:MAG: acyl-CoA/acyl-ACP dehydrogenase [Dehalococcoidales bacterium]
MNFELDEEQVMLKTSARDFLEKECPKELVREIMEDEEKAYSPELWKKMAGLGWLGLSFPEEYGGADFSFLDLAVLLEECGRALVPGPLVPTVVHVGHTILAAGTEEQKQDILPRMINGELILTLAFQEENGSLEASGMTVKAEKSGDNYIINGTKLFVPDAHIADYLLCITRTTDGADKEEGITLFLVDSKADGVQVEILKTMTGEKLCEVVFNNVSVPAKSIIGEVDKGWPVVVKMKHEAEVAEAAWMTGGARWALDTTIDYAKERIAFERPIGSFQAIQHKLAEIALEVEGSTSIIYYAAWTIMENAPDIAMAASMAKAWCGESYKRAVFDGVQIHGGIGFTWDHDMHLYFKRAKACEVNFGDSDYHREKVAKLLEI